LKFPDSPFDVVIREESSNEPGLQIESEGGIPQDLLNLRSSARKLFFDLEVDKENIDPLQSKRNKMNDLLVPKGPRKDSTNLFDALTLRRNYTDVPIDEERTQNSDNNEFFIFSQPMPERKDSITDFSSFKLTKLRSDCSDRSSGNSDFFSHALPSFEEGKPCMLSFYTSQPNPENGEEGKFQITQI
jgi:hypothetical protein